MKLLHIDSSVLGGNSISRTLTAEIVDTEKRSHPHLHIVYRDLAAQPLDHLSMTHIAARQAGVTEHPESIQHDLAEGNKALEEFLAADIVVIGAPMYNFTIPSQLKAWIDRLAVAGKTFNYTDKGVQGLAGGRKLIIASSRGGIYSKEPMAAFDHQETYLRGFFGFLGVTDITFIRAEGVSMGPDQRTASVASARREIAALV